MFLYFCADLTLLHSEWPKLYGVVAVLSAIGLLFIRLKRTKLKNLFCFTGKDVYPLTTDTDSNLLMREVVIV